jgi:DNA-binding HxlR family transcriptional regulator
VKYLSVEKFNPFEKKKYDAKKAMRELDSLVKNLDQHCLAIILFFRQNMDKSFGFNELLKKLDKEKRMLEISFSRQTLSLHLKHLLAYNMLEVREDKESRLKIKPRYYRLSDYWKTLFENFDGLKNYRRINEEFRFEPTENITASLIETSIDFCTRSFAEVILSPKYWGASESKYYSNLVEKLALIHQKLVAEKNQEEKALHTLKEINVLLSRAIREKYDLPNREKSQKS